MRTFPQIGLLSAALLLAAPAQAQTHLPRVASITLCGDEYLLRLGDRSQIASLSERSMSPMAVFPDRARAYPINHKSVEELLAQKVELVILESGGEGQFANAVRQVGIKTVMLPKASTKSFKDIETGVQTIANAIGRPQAAAPVIADMHVRVARLEAAKPPTAQQPIAAFFRPEGGGAAKGTYVDTALQLAGFRNLQTLAGQKGWARMSLENVVQTPPDVFVLGFYDTNRNSLAAVRGRNPLLGRFKAPVIDTPGKYLVCASPALVDGAEHMAQARIKAFGR